MFEDVILGLVIFTGKGLIYEVCGQKRKIRESNVKKQKKRTIAT